MPRLNVKPVDTDNIVGDTKPSFGFSVRDTQISTKDFSGNINDGFTYDDSIRKHHLKLSEEAKNNKTDVGVDDPLENEQDESNIKDLWSEFCEDTSMHGVKKTGKARKYKLRCVIWGVAVLAMVIFLVVTVYGLYSAYKRYPTITNIKIERVDSLMFPAITICNLSPFNKSKVGMTPQRTNLMVKMSPLDIFAEKIDWNAAEYYNYTLPREPEITNSAYDFEESFGLCFYEQKVLECENTFQKRMTSLGMCYTFNTNGTFSTSLTGSSNGLIAIVFIHQDHYYFANYLAAGLKVILHCAGEEPDVDNEGFLASPGFSTYAAIKLTKYKYLSSPFKAFKSTYCLDTEAVGFKNELKFYSTYSHYACLNECRLKYVHTYCKCRVETDPGNETICSFKQEIECYRFLLLYFDTNKTMQAECNCGYPCKRTKYEQQISVAYYPNDEVQKFVSRFNYVNLRENIIELRVYFDSMQYTEVEQIPEYTLNSIAGTLGGQMGFFLGASVLTLSELVEFVLLSIWVLFRRLVVNRPPAVTPH